MGVLLELLPLAAFFLVYRLEGLMAATLALIAATTAALALNWLLYRKVAFNALAAGVLVAVFGGLTLALKDPLFIKIKPTLLNLLFATALICGVALKKPLLKLLLHQTLPMDEEGWRKLSLRWAGFFFFLAALNEIVWRHFSESFWVNFKVFGMFPLTVLFVAAQWPLMQRHALPPQNEDGGGKDSL